MQTTSTATDNGTPASQLVLTPFQNDVIEHMRAGFQVLYVLTSEEAKAAAELNQVAQAFGIGFTSWNCATGFRGSIVLPADKSGAEDKARLMLLKQPQHALDYVVGLPGFDMDKSMDGQTRTATGYHPNDQIVVFNDIDDFLTSDPVSRRHAIDIVEYLRVNHSGTMRPLVFMSSVLRIPDKLKHLVKVIEYALPSQQLLESAVITIAEAAHETSDDAAGRQAAAMPTDEQREAIAKACLGLTFATASNLIGMTFARCMSFSHPEFLPILQRHKANVVKVTSNLQYIDPDTVPAIEGIVGYNHYVSWLVRRSKAYSRAAKDAKIDPPKGVVLIGVPGTGKSMMAKITCKQLNLPGYIVDVGALFGSLVGESEERTRRILQQLTAQKGCVAVFDEADKAFRNAHESTGDAGATQRVFSTILTWLAEQNGDTFVIMTLNRIDGLPPELLRPGRFDAIFTTDLPDAEDRKAILDTHFAKRGVTVDQLALTSEQYAAIVDKTANFTGVEIEQVVIESRYMAWENRESSVPTFDEILRCASQIVSMAQRDPDGLEKIRTYCRTIGQPVKVAQVPAATPQPATQRRIRNTAATATPPTRPGARPTVQDN